MLVNAFSLLVLAASAAAQSTTTLCVAGQCLDGTSNISIGAVVSGPSNSNKQFVLLPGSYAATTEPQELRTTLADSQSRLTYSPGFAPNASQNAQQTISFPLDITLQPGVLCTNVSLFRGQTHFHAVPTSSETMNSTLGAKAPGGGSIVMPSDVWAAFTTGSGNSRLVLWDTVPDLGQLPSGVGNDELTLVGLQSTTCEPACSGNGICTPAGTCVCPGGGGFTGPSCESCVPGFFGPECQPCPADCETCDEGASGSGLCLVPKVANAPKTCNCINGQCDANGACNCNEGWQDGSGGKCSVCRDGFYLAASGNCEVCELGCTRCQANTGICSQCGTGLAQDANNPRRCIADTAGSTLQCAPNQFPNGAECSICSTACTTCTGPGAAACLQCAGTTYKLDGVCVPTNELGICNGSRRVANNAKGTCDACPAGCAECSIPGFTQTSQFSSAQCTKCLPGTYLSQGKCIEACPKGTFISPQDGSTCQACAGTCGSCAGAAQFCLTCTGNSLAHEGSCVATCPAGTFSSNGACLPCHGDCKACSGAGFDQCTSCSTDRPVLVTSGTAQAGRCMETCSKAQFFDATSSRCQSCDSSCSSCNGAGPNQCLACSNEDSILQGGTCATAKCERDSSVVPGLGVCLSTLVAAPYVDNTPPVSPTAPAPPPSNGGHLAWWQILLMVLGCAFICAAFIFCLRRRMRKKRAAQTAAFARTMESKSVWRRTMGWLGDKLFHTRVRDGDVEALTAKLRAQERERDKQEMEMSETRSKIASLDHGRQTQPFSPLPTLSEAPGYGGGRQWDERSYRSARTERTEDHIERSHTHSPRPSIPEVAVYKHVDGERRPQRTSVSSFYSGTVANQRHSPELLLPDVPPMKPHPMDSRSRFSMSSEATSLFRSVSQRGGNGPDVPQDVRQPTYEDLPIRQHPTGSTSRSGQSDPFSNSRRQPSIDQLRQPLQSQFTGHTEESGRIKNPFWL